MTYRTGQRIVLVHTDDPFTDLHPGDTGTVTSVDGQQLTVAVSWDSGSELSMCLDAGDRIRVIAEPAPTVDPSAPIDTADEVTDQRHPRWGHVLDALRLLGVEAGRTAADWWWAQDSVGARAGGDTAATSRKVLAGIDDGDPAVLDTLPTVDLLVNDDEPDFYTAVVGEDNRSWSDLIVAERQEAIDAYRDGADSALIDRVSEHCRLVADPTGDGRDLHHLHPDDRRPSAGAC